MASRILANGFYLNAAIVTDETLSGFPASNLIAGRTNRQAGFEVGAARNVVFDLGADTTLTGITFGLGIAKHNLGTVAASVIIGVSDDNVPANFNTEQTFAITSDDVQYKEFSISGSWRYIRVRISGHTGNAYVSNLSFNVPLIFPGGQPVGFVDPVEGFKDEIRSNVTRGNELAGLSVISRPKEFRISSNKVNTGDFDTFAASLYDIVAAGPFYFKWATTAEDGIDSRPAFCWLKDKMPATRFDTATTKSMSFDCMGFT